jgi:Arc/MetJ-type ribon-helix-helix transcriptional regulator
MHGLPGGAAGQADGAFPSRSDVAAAALEAARLQLALLQASDEFTRLAATHAHGGELATLEQDTRFAALRSRRG